MSPIRHAACFLGSLALTVSVGVVLVSSQSADAAAHAQPTCTNTEAGAISGRQVDDYTRTSGGTRADVRVIVNDDVVCQHVSSLFVWNGLGGAEFGYVIGFSNCTGYTGSFYENAKPFFFVRTAPGTQEGCKLFGGINLPQGTYQSMQTSDQNGDKRWGPWLNGEQLLPGDQGYVLDFNQGMNGFGMERGNGPDPGYSRNNNLEEFHNSNTWTLWDNISQNANSDPRYVLKKWSLHSGGTVEP